MANTSLSPGTKGSTELILPDTEQTFQKRAGKTLCAFACLSQEKLQVFADLIPFFFVFWLAPLQGSTAEAVCRGEDKDYFHKWLWKYEKTLIFLCAGQGEQCCGPAVRAGTPWLAGTASPLSCTRSSLPFNTDRKETARGDLHHQLLVSIMLEQGFSKAKGFQLHHTSTPRAAAQHQEGPFTGGRQL